MSVPPPPAPGPAAPATPSPASPTLGPLTPASPAPAAPGSFYEEVGGAEVFARIVHRFYEVVADDAVLRPLYPEEDLGPAEVRLRMFLEQYWGGPRTYSEQRGHPRLRMRHAPFVIGHREKEHWLAAMRAGVDEAGLTPQQEDRLWAYLVMAAESLVNQPH